MLRVKLKELECGPQTRFHNVTWTQASHKIIGHIDQTALVTVTEMLKNDVGTTNPRMSDFSVTRIYFK